MGDIYMDDIRNNQSWFGAMRDLFSDSAAMQQRQQLPMLQGLGAQGASLPFIPQSIQEIRERLGGISRYNEPSYEKFYNGCTKLIEAIKRTEIEI